MTFNIRYGTANDGDNRWEFRRGLVLDVIHQYKPDLLCLQEALRFQMDEIRHEFADYKEIGVSRMGNEEGEYAPILYDQKRLKVVNSGTFWFSDTPDQPSTHWGNHYLRICTWANFIDRSTEELLFVFNVHWDHESQHARVRSAQLLADRISDQVGDNPFVITGDFNAGERSESIQEFVALMGRKASLIIRDSFRDVYPNATQVGTFNGFKGDRDGEKIDFIFVSKTIQVLDASIEVDQANGRFPSDHFPVVAEIEW